MQLPIMRRVDRQYLLKKVDTVLVPLPLQKGKNMREDNLVDKNPFMALGGQLLLPLPQVAKNFLRQGL